jgi:WW domain-binding protein 11
LKDRFGPVPVVSAVPPNGKGPAKGMQSSAEKKDDYQKFVEEMDDILGTAKP